MQAIEKAVRKNTVQYTSNSGRFIPHEPPLMSFAGRRLLNENSYYKEFNGIAWVLLAFAMIVCFMPQMGAAVYASDNQPAIQLVPDDLARNIEGKQKSSVWYGNYKQSLKSDNKPKEYNVDPIKWKALANADGKIFLLSDKILDVREYNEENKPLIKWSNCTLRYWLNGTNEYLSEKKSFRKDAFDHRESNATFLTPLQNEDNGDISGGAQTADHVFLLSITEATNSDFGFSTDFGSTDTRKATYTDYVAGGGGIGSSPSDQRRWWLRSPGQNSTQTTAYAATVNGVDLSKYRAPRSIHVITLFVPLSIWIFQRYSSLPRL